MIAQAVCFFLNFAVIVHILVQVQVELLIVPVVFDELTVHRFHDSLKHCVQRRHQETLILLGHVLDKKGQVILEVGGG